MDSAIPSFRPPSAGERIFNRLFGWLVGLGVGFSYNYLLQVRGRKTGRIYSTPIDLLELNGKPILVAPRGRTQWVRNAEAAGEVTLKKGRTRRTFRIREIPPAERPPILKAYLERFRIEVQRYFPVPAGSPPEAFADVAHRNPPSSFSRWSSYVRRETDRIRHKVTSFCRFATGCTVWHRPNPLSSMDGEAKKVRMGEHHETKATRGEVLRRHRRLAAGAGSCLGAGPRQDRN